MTCKVFVLGHPTQGESIIFVLYGDEQVLYSCVIDSFMIGDRIIPGEYLNKLKLKKITELFWTHPHDDHSAGILQLVDTFSPDSVYLPVELLSLPEENESIAKEVLQQLNSYKCYDGRIKRYQPKIKEVAANMILHHESIWAENYLIPFEMLAIAPCSGKVRKNVLGENYATLNDYCNGVQREHNKKLNNGLPILHKVPPKRDYGRYFCIMAEKGGTSHGGLTEKLSPFFHAKKQEVNAYGR